MTGAVCRILHVEDSEDDSTLVRMGLDKAGLSYTYHRVDAEPEYAAQLEAGTPDVILCDYDMPDFSAEGALQIMQARGLDVPFIIVSHHIDQSDAVVAMQRGASDYLSKRDLGRLGKAIRAAMDRAGERRARARAQTELAASEAMKRGILDSLDSRIAVLDSEGTIVAANKAWIAFDDQRIGAGFASARQGENYLEMLQRAADAGNPFAKAGIEVLREVMARQRTFGSLDYQLPIGSATRWYIARVMPLEGSEHGAVISHTDITDRMMAHIALENAHRRLQALSRRVITIQEEERRSISRELHDDVGQSMAALKIALLRVQGEPAASAPDLVSQSLGIADDCIDRLRHLAQELRPPQLDQLGLGDAISWLVDRQRGVTGMQIDCTVTGLDERAPREIEAACYRIAQEAINNASKHAKATKIAVTIESDGRLLKLTIRDDGQGFDEESTRGRALRAGSLGLISMEERAQYAGGRFKLRSVPQAGTTVSAVFPLVTDAA